MELHRRQNRLLLACILLSLLLHLLLLLMPEADYFRPPPPAEPVYVEVRPRPQTDRPRELDIPVREELEQPRETPAERLGPADQVVEEERAPEGEDDMDVTARPAAPKPVPEPTPAPTVEQPQPPSPPAAEPVRPEAKPEPARPPAPQTETTRVTPEGDRPQAEPAPASAPEPKPEPATPSKPLPDLERLTQISPEALASIESDWRRKYRENLQQGDTVWLDTEQDLLNSFMRRFRDNIYLVWDYPAEALRQMQQGTCLLRITINRQGDVEDVRLLESSGYPLLDREAMDSVRKGATYGPLPRAYPHETLKIMAFFQYGIGDTIQYRRRIY